MGKTTGKTWTAWLLSAVLIGALLLPGCGSEDGQRQEQDGGVKAKQENRQQTGHERKQADKKGDAASSKKRNMKTKSAEQSDGKEHKQGWKALEGGAEDGGRPLKQVSNHLLQQRFPSVLVLRGPTNAPRVALTFDDGPDQRFTPQVLDVLKKHRVPATFFLVGARVAALPDVTRRIAVEGHVIGNHTYWHPKLWEESAERLQWEVTETDRAIQEVVGYSPKLFRPPYGGLNDSIVQQLSDMNYSIIGWSVDSLDWSQIPADEVETNVLGNMHPGAIILMHSGGHWTQDLSGMIEALDRIIPKLKKEGIEFVTIPELIDVPASKIPPGRPER